MRTINGRLRKQTDIMDAAIPSSWDHLLSEIQARSTDDVVVDDIMKLLKSYSSDSQDWNDYAKFDPHT